MANTIPYIFPQFFDDSGNPLTSGYITSKAAGTSSDKDTFGDYEKSSTNPNPIPLASNGRPTYPIFLEDGMYDFKIYNSSDVQVAQQLGIAGSDNGGSVNIPTVETIEELLYLPNGFSDYVKVLGYYSAGDGGGGTFKWTAGITADGGWNLYPIESGGPDGWRRIDEGQQVTPYQFGAKGDGVTDDLSAINNCITAAQTLGKSKVYFPKGTFGISDSIDLKTLLNISDASVVQGWFEIEGENPRIARLKPIADISGGMIELINAGTGNAANARQIKITNLGFYADATANKSAWYGLWLRWVAEVYYDNLLFYNCATKRDIYHDVVFVVNIQNCVGVGKQNNLSTGGAPDAVDIAYNTPIEISETVTFSNSGGHLLATYTTDFADSSVIRVSGGTLPTGISANTDYYLKRQSATTAKICVGAYEHRNGTYVAYTDAGSGTRTIVNSEQDKLTGLYLENTCTTTIINSCRFNGNIYGINLLGGDQITIINCAPESSKYNAILVSGSINNLNINNNYFEGTVEYSIKVNGFIGSGNITGNFFNDDYAIELGAVQINSLNIVGNLFSFVDGGILDQGCSYNYLSIEKNYFREATAPEIVMQKNTSDTRLRLNVSDNQTTYKYYERVDSNLNRKYIDAWTISGAATVGYSVNRYNDNDAYDIAGSAGTSDLISIDLFSIETARNNHLKNKWITLEIPVIAISGSSGSYIRIGDGVASSDYNLRAEVGTWNIRRLYYQISSSATTLNIRIYPNGDNITVCDPVIRQGLYGDNAEIATSLDTLKIRPWNSVTTPLTIYDNVSRTIKMYDFKLNGTPSYAILDINGPSGVQSVTIDGSQGIKLTSSRVQVYKGSDVASAGDITLGQGNFFRITGTATINSMNTANWQAGSEVTLEFDSTATVKHLQAGAYTSFLLAGAADFVGSSNDTLTVVYNGTRWVEKCRAVI